jgi:hypothetical protein
MGPNERTHDMRLIRPLLIAAILAGAAPVLADEPAPAAEEPPSTSKKATSEQSEEELAKEAQNPLADVYSFPFQDNLNLNYGPNKQVQNVLNFQPVIPIHAGPVNVIARTIIPLISTPSIVPGQSGGGTTGLGDISFTAFLSPAAPSETVWGVGPVVIFPTATSPQVGSQSTWGLGPSFALVTMPGHWVLGFVTNAVWSVAGASGNSFLLQYFVNYNLGEGWYLNSSPLITAQWNLSYLPSGAPSQWTVPFGGGVGKLQKFGKIPINFSVEAYWNAWRPENLPSSSWTIRLQAVLLL